MKITKAIHGVNRVENRAGEKLANAAAGVLEGIHGSPDHPKVLRMRARARALRIQRSNGELGLRKKTIGDQNRFVEIASRIKGGIENPGQTVQDVAAWATKNPGAAVGTAVNAAGVAALGAAGYPGAATAWEATPFVPAGAALDKIAQKKSEVWDQATTDASRVSKIITNPVRRIKLSGLISGAKMLISPGSTVSKDFENVGEMGAGVYRGLEESGSSILTNGRKYILGYSK